MGNTTEDSPAGVDADELLSAVPEGTLKLSVTGSDDVPAGTLETAPEGEVVLGPEVSLEAGLDASTELLGPSPADVTELEAGGIVALLSGSELSELVTKELATTDEVSSAELGRPVPEDSGFVVVGCALCVSLKQEITNLRSGYLQILRSTQRKEPTPCLTCSVLQLKAQAQSVYRTMAAMKDQVDQQMATKHFRTNSLRTLMRGRNSKALHSLRSTRSLLADWRWHCLMMSSAVLSGRR